MAVHATSIGVLAAHPTTNVIRLPTAATNPVRQGSIAAARDFRLREGCLSQRRRAVPSADREIKRTPELAIVCAFIATADDAWRGRALAFAELMAEQAPGPSTAAAMAFLKRTCGEEMDASR